jgi:polysaccharide export outer membrane protein
MKALRLALVMAFGAVGAFGLREASAQTAVAVPSQAPPAQSAVAATDYLVGPQDVLKITVFGEPQLSSSVRVDSDGSIPFQYLGRVKAENLTVLAIAEVIRKGLADGYVRNPQVSVEMEQYHSQNVYVLGEVKAAGKYAMAGNSTLLDVLTQAGSMTPTAGHWVLINHAKPGTGLQGPSITDANTPADLRVNLRDIQSGQAQNIKVLDGDTVFVPIQERVSVTGNVRNPGAYPFDDGMTVFEAIGLAGGVSDKGSNSRISVKRMIDGKLKEIDVKQNDIVKPGDQVYVKARLL